MRPVKSGKKALLRNKKAPHLKKIGTKFRQGPLPLDIPRSSERVNPAKKVTFTPEKVTFSVQPGPLGPIFDAD